MNKKVYKILPLILILAIGIMSIRLFVVLIPKKADKIDTQKGVSYLSELEKTDANEAENIVRKAQEKYAGVEECKKIAKALKKGNYKYAFKNIIIAGDSIVKAVSAYGILDDSQVIAKVGATTEFLKEESADIVSANPKYLVLHFGENQLSTEAQASAFTKAYAKCINSLKKQLPETEIYVDSIFPVKPAAYKQNSYLKNINYYNKAIKKMAKECGVHYIDFDPLWASFSKDYYDLDGIHPAYSFYTEQYLPFIISEVGLGVN